VVGWERVRTAGACVQGAKVAFGLAFGVHSFPSLVPTLTSRIVTGITETGHSGSPTTKLVYGMLLYRPIAVVMLEQNGTSLRMMIHIGTAMAAGWGVWGGGWGVRKAIGEWTNPDGHIAVGWWGAGTSRVGQI